jgi:hypothetical protein
MDGSGCRNSQILQRMSVPKNRRTTAISLSKTALEARLGGALDGDMRRLSAHAHIGFESPLTARRFSNGAGGWFQRLDSAPRHLLYMSGTSHFKAMNLITHALSVVLTPQL